MSLSKALGKLLLMEPVARGCGLGCTVFTSRSSILEAHGTVGFSFVLVHYLSCVISVFLTLAPAYLLSGLCTALEPQQRETWGATNISYAYTSLPPGTHIAG